MKNIETLLSVQEDCTGCGERAYLAWAPSVTKPMHFCKHCLCEVLGKLLKQEEEWREWVDATKKV